MANIKETATRAIAPGLIFMGITSARADFLILTANAFSHSNNSVTNATGRDSVLSEQIAIFRPHQFTGAPVTGFETIAAYYNDGNAGSFSHQQAARSRNFIRDREHGGGQFFSVIVGPAAKV